MVRGLGVDIVQTSRFERMSEGAIRRLLTEREQRDYDEIKLEQSRLEFLSSRFAAKEAFVKALGEGFRSLQPKDITVIHDEAGSPSIELPAEKSTILDGLSVFLSISHEKDYSVAVVVLDGKV